VTKSADAICVKRLLLHDGAVEPRGKHAAEAQEPEARRTRIHRIGLDILRALAKGMVDRGVEQS
jgi:hypothetical protein